MKTEQILPITEILEDRFNELSLIVTKHMNAWTDNRNADQRKDEIFNMIPQVRTFELELISKAKQEERERIVGILGTMKNESYSWTDFTWKISVEDTLQEAIDRITS